MANVTVSPVVPFNNEDEQKSEYVHDDNIKKQPTSSSKSKTEGHDLFEAVQQATFKQVQISHQGGIAVKDGWLHDKHPGKDQFDCPYCNESGEWVGIRCGTCGQLWDLQDEHAILLR